MRADEVLKKLRRASPDGAKPDLGAFAMQANLARRCKPKVTNAKV